MDDETRNIVPVTFHNNGNKRLRELPKRFFPIR